MNRYERYKDSGIPWLGKVPEHWEIKPLKFSINNISHKVESQLSNLRYFGLENIESFTGRLLLDIELESEGIANEFQENDVLFGKLRPYLAKVHFSRLNGLVSTEALVFRASNAVDPKFLFYFCVSSDFIDAVNGTTFGSKMPRASWDNIGNFRMLIPSLKEQTAIAHYLDTKLGEIDALIGKQQTLLEKLAEQRTAVITHAVTKGLNPAAPMKKSGVEWLGDVPAHWDVSPFKLVMNSIIDYRGKTPEKTNSGVFLITARNIKNGIIDYTLSQEFIDEDNYEEVMRRGLPKLGQVLMTTEAPLGEVAQIDRTDVALAQRVLKFDGKKDKLDNRFLKYFILSKAFQASLYKFATGSTALGIKSERLSYLKSLLPPVTEQTNIANYLDQETVKIDRLCETVNQTIGRLKEYRTALITQAVTGKIKVTNE